jgi:acetyl esterase/lipase
VPTLFLALSIVGLVLALNALRPIPAGTFSVPSFFAGWITSEMAPHWLVLHVVGVVVLVLAGALDAARGWIALGLAAFTAAVLLVLIRQSAAAKDVVEHALDDAGFDLAAQEVADDEDVKWWHLGLPFRRRRPDVVRVKDIAYGPYGRRNKLDVFHHRDKPAGAPVVIQIHGGGWVIGSKEDQGRPIALQMAAHGWVCVLPNYRLSPRGTFPEHIVDLKMVIGWVRQHIADFGGDPSFVAVTGGSAGGHLVALVALSQNDPDYQPGFEAVDTSVQAAVPYYGVYDVTNELGTRYGRQRLRSLLERMVFKKRYADDPEVFRRASPVLRVAENAPDEIPPFFVIHGSHDSLVPVAEGRLFVERLRARSEATVVYAELPGAQHAFDVFGSVRCAHVLRGVEHFLSTIHTRTRSQSDA